MAVRRSGLVPDAAQQACKPIKCSRIAESYLGVRKATLAARAYAEAHGGQIPTTAQLAGHMGIQSNEFRYVVVPTGLLDDHMERVGGDWPEVLVAEKHGGANGNWAFGFVDGMCSIQSIASYKEMHNSAALEAISQRVKGP